METTHIENVTRIDVYCQRCED